MLKTTIRPFALIVTLALLSLSLLGCALFQPVASPPTSPLQPQLPERSLSSSGPPFLTCQASALPLGAPNVEGWALQCTLVQAPNGDTHFIVQLMLLDARGHAQYFFTDVCPQEGTLLGGQGDCRGNFFTPPGLVGRKLELFAVSLPSKRMSDSVQPLESGATR